MDQGVEAAHRVKRGWGKDDLGQVGNEEGGLGHQATGSPDLRVAEVMKMDMKVEDGKVTAFRTRVALSFKYEG